MKEGVGVTRYLAGRSRAARRGAAAAEMAIVLPFLVFTFAVAFDYCRIFYAVQVVNNAARCGAMYASGTVSAAIGETPLQAAQQAALVEAASLNPPLQVQDVTLTTNSTGVTVTVKYQFQNCLLAWACRRSWRIRTVTMPPRAAGAIGDFARRDEPQSSASPHQAGRAECSRENYAHPNLAQRRPPPSGVLR